MLDNSWNDDNVSSNDAFAHDDVSCVDGADYVSFVAIAVGSPLAIYGNRSWNKFEAVLVPRNQMTLSIGQVDV